MPTSFIPRHVINWGNDDFLPDFSRLRYDNRSRSLNFVHVAPDQLLVIVGRPSEIQLTRLVNKVLDRVSFLLASILLLITLRYLLHLVRIVVIILQKGLQLALRCLKVLISEILR